VKALKDVSINFKKGEVHALLGENGAGKSTLIKIVSGFQKADKGSEILLDEKLYQVNNTFEAINKGIQTVYQDLQVVPLASVAENIMFDKLNSIGRSGILSWKKITTEAEKYLDMVGLKVDPNTAISRISIGQRQLVVIAKAIASNIKVLMLDEPTSSLTANETDYLFKVIETLKNKGILIIFVSHILEEVLQISDRISILRDGVCAITDEVSNFDRKKIIYHMIGRDEDTKPLGDFSPDKSKKVLEVKNINRAKLAENVSFDLYKGEILGFYGLMGSGRTEIAKILIGQEKHDSGNIKINGKASKIKGVSDALLKYKMGYITEDRRKDGLILSSSIKNNITITVWKKLSNLFGYVSDKKETDAAMKQYDALDIKATGLNQKVSLLSGGNQQKVNIGKWLAAECDILIIDEPTVGVDVGAKEYFRKLIWKIAKEYKKSIILISSDMPEIIKLSNRILVFSQKKVVGEVDNTEKDYKKNSRKIGNYISEFQIAES
jgi:ribose transport system ATP-binding protein